MGESIVSSGTRKVYVDTVTPNVFTSAAGAAVVTGSDMDMRAWRSLVYTLLNADNTITFWIYGANASNFSDEVIVSGPTDIAAGAAGSYAIALAPFNYYRVKVADKVGGSHGNVRVVGVAKY